MKPILPMVIRRRDLLQIAGLAAWPAQPARAARAPYPVAEFQLEHTVINEVYPAWSPKMGYNHDADITFFKGRYVAAWNANPDIPEESRPGQCNYVSVSKDFRNWSVPTPAFTAKGGAVNPVEVVGTGFQWQPNFINYRDEILFCAWCVSGEDAAVYVSTSRDGIHWENQRLPEQLPKSYAADHLPGSGDEKGFEKLTAAQKESLKARPTVAFPTNHGLLTKSGAMLFPVAFPPRLGPASGLPNPLQVCALISNDAGKTWHWGECTPFLPVEKFLKPGRQNKGKRTHIGVWEPHFFEHPDGRIGLLIRVTNSAPEDGLTADQMILYAESNDGGMTFSYPKTVDVETVSSRHMAFHVPGSSAGLAMAANDWLPGYTPSLRDRHYLAAYFSSVSDPDMLIPGPVIQKAGTSGHYPNGEIRNGEMLIAYSRGVKPRAIYASRMRHLPDFRTPFFLRRESRPPVVIDKVRQVAHFPETFSSLGLVLTKELVEREHLTLEFAVKLLTVPAFYPGQSKDEAVNGMTLLTIGAADHHNTAIRVSRPLPPYDIEVMRNNKWVKLGQTTLFEPVHFHLVITGSGYSVRFNNGKEWKAEGRLLRKINFGGFYIPPVAYPTTGTFELDLKEVAVY